MFRLAIWLVLVALVSVGCKDDKKELQKLYKETAVMYNIFKPMLAAWPDTTQNKPCPDKEIIKLTPQRNDRKLVFFAWGNLKWIAKPNALTALGIDFHLTDPRLIKLPERKKILEDAEQDAKEAFGAWKAHRYVLVWRETKSALPKVIGGNQFVPGFSTGVVVIYDFRSGKPLCWHRLATVRNQKTIKGTYRVGGVIKKDGMAAGYLLQDLLKRVKAQVKQTVPQMSRALWL